MDLRTLRRRIAALASRLPPAHRARLALTVFTVERDADGVLYRIERAVPEPDAIGYGLTFTPLARREVATS